MHDTTQIQSTRHVCEHFMHRYMMLIGSSLERIWNVTHEAFVPSQASEAHLTVAIWPPDALCASENSSASGTCLFHRAKGNTIGVLWSTMSMKLQLGQLCCTPPLPPAPRSS